MIEDLRSKALIIDHDERWQRVILRHLRGLGIEADICSSRDEAIEKIGKNEYLFLTLDLSLDADGLSYEGLELLRSLVELEIVIPIFVISGNVVLQYVIDASNYDNVVHYCSKEDYSRGQLRTELEKKILSIVEDPKKYPLFEGSSNFAKACRKDLNLNLLEYSLAGKRRSYILFIDCERFSRRTDEQQANIFSDLIKIAKDTQIIEEASNGHGFTPLLTGDGMAIIFGEEDYSLFPLRLAFEIQSKISEKNLDMKFRSGIHFGDLFLFQNPVGLKQFIGSQLNVTARIMDFGSGNHILSSGDYYRHCVEKSSNVNIEGIVKESLGKRRHSKGLEIDIYNYHMMRLGNKNRKLRTS